MASVSASGAATAPAAPASPVPASASASATTTESSEDEAARKARNKRKKAAQVKRQKAARQTLVDTQTATQDSNPNLAPHQFRQLSMHQFFNHQNTKLKLAYSQLKGRHCIAEERIEAGTQAFKAQPAAYIVTSQLADSTCHLCLNHSAPKLYKCGQCNFVHYCSTNCTREDSAQHALECVALKQLNGMQFHAQRTDALRLLMRILYNRAVELHAQQLIKSNDKQSKANSNKHVSLPPSGSRWSDIESLVSHDETCSGPEREQIRTVLAVVGRIILSSASDSPAASHLSPQQLWPGVECALRVMLQIHCNAHSIVTSNKEILALGVYTASSLLNHSCRPSAVHIYRPITQVALINSVASPANGTSSVSSAPVNVRWAQEMRIIRSLNRGQELSYSYIDVYTSRVIRQASLKEIYKVEKCYCDRCTEPMATSHDRFIEGIVCQSCSSQCTDEAKRLTDAFLITPSDTPDDSQSDSDAKLYHCPQCKAEFTQSELQKTALQHFTLRYSESVKAIAAQRIEEGEKMMLESVLGSIEIQPTTDSGSTSSVRSVSLHPFHFLVFNAHLHLVRACYLQSSQCKLRISSCQLVFAALVACDLVNHPEAADVLSLQAEAHYAQAQQLHTQVVKARQIQAKQASDASSTGAVSPSSRSLLASLLIQRQACLASAVSASQRQVAILRICAGQQDPQTQDAINKVNHLQKDLTEAQKELPQNDEHQ